MVTPLRMFVSQFVGVVAAVVTVVAVIAFLSIPFTLGAHPGEARPADLPAVKHMT